MATLDLHLGFDGVEWMANDGAGAAKEEPRQRGAKPLSLPVTSFFVMCHLSLSICVKLASLFV